MSFSSLMKEKTTEGSSLICGNWFAASSPCPHRVFCFLKCYELNTVSLTSALEFIKFFLILSLKDNDVCTRGLRPFSPSFDTRMSHLRELILHRNISSYYHINPLRHLTASLTQYASEGRSKPKEGIICLMIARASGLTCSAKYSGILVG